VLDVELTLNSGQVFLWSRVGNNYYIVNGDDLLKVSSTDYLSNYSDDAHRFFRLDDDINAINSSICKDGIISDAMSRFYGLRLLRQHPFQCMISFICATNTSIKHVTTMLNRLSLRFGEKVVYDGMLFHKFPDAKVLASASINELVSCSLGYRARYIKDASREYSNIDVEYLKRTDYNNAKEALMSISGIGNKVADCILLFALEHLEAFPIDVWIARALSRYYSDVVSVKGRLSTNEYIEAAEAMRAYFGRYAGYAQQYLYCYSRTYLH
jgi:N-glycosylase/DNA lyase